MKRTVPVIAFSTLALAFSTNHARADLLYVTLANDDVVRYDTSSSGSPPTTVLH